MALLFPLPMSFPSLGVLVPLLGVPFLYDVPCLPSLLEAFVLLEGLYASLDGEGIGRGVRFRWERGDSCWEPRIGGEEVFVSSSCSGFTACCSFPCVASSSHFPLISSHPRLPTHPACARKTTRVTRDSAESLGVQESWRLSEYVGDEREYEGEGWE
jgi:hypothetical protein